MDRAWINILIILAVYDIALPALRWLVKIRLTSPNIALVVTVRLLKSTTVF